MARTRRAPASDKPTGDFLPDAGFGEPTKSVDPVEDVQALALEDVEVAPEGEFDPRDAEIARLKAENAALKGVSGSLKGGKFTVSWKDGPTLTIKAAVGESVSEALARHGVHSTPHKVEVHDAPADAKCGQHLPNGSVRSFTGPEK